MRKLKKSRIKQADVLASVILSVVLDQGFVVVERGPQQLDKGTHFNLEDYIVRRPHRRLTALFLQFARKLRRKLRWSSVNDMLTAKEKR